MDILVSNPSFDYLIPRHFVDPVRIGRDQDGGYVIPQTAMQHSTAVLSLGLGDDWSFEQHWAQSKPETVIHVYDGAIDYNNWGTAHYKDYQSFFTKSVRHINKNIGVDGGISFHQAFNELKGHRVFVKIDIEGSEYRIIKDIVARANDITGMVIEFHSIEDLGFQKALLKLQEYFHVVHIHGNNCGPLNCDGLPTYLEITFLNQTFGIKDGHRYECYLPGVDFPCCPKNDEYIIKFNSMHRSSIG